MLSVCECGYVCVSRLENCVSRHRTGPRAGPYGPDSHSLKAVAKMFAADSCGISLCFFFFFGSFCLLSFYNYDVLHDVNVFIIKHTCEIYEAQLSFEVLQQTNLNSYQCHRIRLLSWLLLTFMVLLIATGTETET